MAKRKSFFRALWILISWQGYKLHVNDTHTHKKGKYDIRCTVTQGKEHQTESQDTWASSWPRQHTCGQVTSHLASSGLSESISCSTQVVQPSCTQYLTKLLKRGKFHVRQYPWGLGQGGYSWHMPAFFRRHSSPQIRKFSRKACMSD